MREGCGVNVNCECECECAKRTSLLLPKLWADAEVDEEEGHIQQRPEEGQSRAEWTCSCELCARVRVRLCVPFTQPEVGLDTELCFCPGTDFRPGETAPPPNARVHT